MMVQIENLEHPAVELKLPFDGDNHEYEIPEDTTLFFWGTLAAGTAERLPPTQSTQGAKLFQTALDARDRLALTVSIDGESMPLVTDSFFRKEGYKGLAWWIAIDAIPLPTTVTVELETSGPQPTDQDAPLVLWTEHGDSIQWGNTHTSTLELRPADMPLTDVATKQEQLWEHQTVYVPRLDT